MEKNGTSTNGLIKEAPAAPPPLLGSARINFFVMSLFALLASIFQRLNMNFALVCMVKVVAPNHTMENVNSSFATHTHTSHNASSPEENFADELECTRSVHLDNSSSRFEGEFEWDKAVQANILGSFFYGFIATQILGGWLSDKFGGKYLYIGSILVLSLLTLLNPLAAEQGPEYLFTVRLLMGLSHGALMPLINVLGVRWAGQTERAFLLSIAYFGFSLAAFITYPFCAMICKYLGWSYIFYITGGLGLIWCVFAQFLIFSWPADHPRISNQELEYLGKTAASQKDGAQANKRLVIPWRRIILSGPSNIVHLTHFCAIWSMTTIAISLPLFLKEVLFMDISKNGMFSSLPFLGMLVLHMGVGALFDHLRRRNIWSITVQRKIFNTTGFLIPGISLCFMSLLTCNKHVAGIIGISIGIAFCQFALMGGYFLSIFEIAPRFSGILTGITNTIGVIPGFLCPIIVGYITQDGTRESWLNAFYIGAGANFLGAAVYLLFGSSKLQPWAVPKPRLSREMKPLEIQVQDKLLIKEEEANA